MKASLTLARHATTAQALVDGASGANMARMFSLAFAAAAVVACLASVRLAFIPPMSSRAGHAEVSARSIGALAGAGMAAPAFAEEAAASKIPLGGGFAINLDIPETGVVNIVVLIAGLLYLLAPLLSESMATREKEIQTDIEDAVAKYEEATARLA